jgi:hypothetical protein
MFRDFINHRNAGIGLVPFEFNPILRYYYTMKKQIQKKLHKKMRQAERGGNI